MPHDPKHVSRRDLLKCGVAAAGMTALSARVASTAEGATFMPQRQPNFKYCLNTSTIRGQSLSLPDEVRIAAEAGYDGIEPWIPKLDNYVKDGGSLSDLRKRIEDGGLIVESAIGFAEWIVDDPKQREAGLEQAKRDMDRLRQIGGIRIAAPPTGAAREGGQLDLFAVADRYRALLDAGREIGVVPQLEVWGFSRNLSRLGEAVMVTIEADHPDSCLLPDVYHIFKGGSGFSGLSLLSSSAIHVFHMNDYPDTPSREEMDDSHRVYPGDGIAPLSAILQSIHHSDGNGVALSLELFNRDLWKQDALEVAKTGLAKMKAAVSSSGAGSESTL